jgi:plasmid stability protein
MRKNSAAQLVVRNLEQDVKTRLQKRARRHGRSMEEEVRDILRDAVKDEARQEEGFGTRFASYFKGLGLKEGDIRELRGEVWARPVDFSGPEFEPKKSRK